MENGRTAKIIGSVTVVAGAIAFFAAAIPADAQQRKKESKETPAFKQAVCFCRATNRDGASWASCMAGRGFNVAPGSGSHISC